MYRVLRNMYLWDSEIDSGDGSGFLFRCSTAVKLCLLRYIFIGRQSSRGPEGTLSHCQVIGKLFFKGLAASDRCVNDFISLPPPPPPIPSSFLGLHVSPRFLSFSLSLEYFQPFLSSHSLSLSPLPFSPILTHSLFSLSPPLPLPLSFLSHSSFVPCPFHLHFSLPLLLSPILPVLIIYLSQRDRLGGSRGGQCFR